MEDEVPRRRGGRAAADRRGRLGVGRRRPVRDVVDKNLRLAIDALLRDASGMLPRSTGRTVAIKTRWVWMKPFLERNAAVLEETEDTLVVVPDVMDGLVFAGVNILDKKSITVTPTDKK